MELKLEYKEVDMLLDALSLLKSTIERRRRSYEPFEIEEIDDLISKIILTNNKAVNS